MKRSGAIILAIFYCITVTGFALNLHYCGKLLSSVQINSSAKSCGMYAAKAMKCCNDKTIDVKVKDAHQSVSFSYLAKTFIHSISKATYLQHDMLNKCLVNERLLRFSFAKAPPGSTAVYLKNCIFRV